MFLSGETLKRRATEVLSRQNPAISGNYYTLHLGSEAAATSHYESDGRYILPILRPNQGISIGAGQTAYLLTDEFVRMPADCMGFISLDTNLKFKGLDDISGFHVSPGYSGRLVFVVSNHSQVAVVIRRGDPAFRLWLATLDRPTDLKPSAHNELNRIPNEYLPGIADGRDTVQSVASDVKDLRQQVGWLFSVLMIVVTTMFGLIVYVANNSGSASDIHKPKLETTEGGS